MTTLPSSRALTSSGVEALRSHIKGLPLVELPAPRDDLLALCDMAEASLSKPRRAAKQKRKAKRYSEAAMQRAYHQGFRDGRHAEAMGSFP